MVDMVVLMDMVVCVTVCRCGVCVGCMISSAMCYICLSMCDMCLLCAYVCYEIGRAHV